MCGIAGYSGTMSIPPARINACLTAMKRRGPDHQDSRSWASPDGRHTVLLHSRLSIIDLDPRSNQPFNNGRDWIVFNGEIYNYRELRRKLVDNGANLSTNSDTEVLLRVLQKTGGKALDACEGMWAFALFREQAGTLMLSRDRFGEKPLYIYRDASGIYFGSEIKFIVALLGRVLKVNTNHLSRYLVNGYKAIYKSKETFFLGVEELPPGSCLNISGSGDEHLSWYWTPKARIDDSMSYAQAIKGARDHLIRSVELRLRADVPLAFCQSGGVDSNALIGIAKRVFNYDVHGFTIVNTDARYEEQDMVECAVKDLAVRNTQIPVTTDRFLEQLRELVRYHDAPVYTITYYAQWMLQKAIAEAGYRVAVSGTGADEVFSGYYDHHLAYLYEIRGNPELHAVSKSAWGKHIRPIIRNPHLGNAELFVKNREFRDHIFLDAEGFAAYLQKPWLESFSEEQYSSDLLRNRMMNELFHESVPVILHEDDLNAMYFSIENRSPYLDRALFDFCNSIPTRHLIRDGRAKAVLRDAMAGLAPEVVMQNRRKVGFNAPIRSFLDTDNPTVRSELLRDSPVFDLIRRDKIEALLAKPDLPNSESKFLFYFLNTKFFLEEFSA